MNRSAKLILILAGFTMLGNLSLWAQTSSTTNKGWVKNKGVQYNIAEDRRFEELGGSFTEPEGLDKYMKRKFDALDEKVKILDERMVKMSEQLKEIKAKLK